MAGRSRSSTVSSLTSSLRREVLPSDQSPLQPTRELPGSSAAGAGGTSGLSTWATPAFSEHSVASSYASQHTLKTIRGRRDSASDSGEPTADDDVDDRFGGQGGPERGSPHYILDLNPSRIPSETQSGSMFNGGRDRSATFGGVPLPESPHPEPSSARTRDNEASPRSSALRERATSRPSPLIRTETSTSLHLGGSSKHNPALRWWFDFESRRPILAAGMKAGGLFGTSLLVLYILLRSLLPPIDEEHKAAVKLPKSFEDLKNLNEVLQIYKERHYGRVLGSFVTVYLFIQAFSIPGSMYMSILGGAMYGVLTALPLVCFCVATGALLCFAISAALGPAVLMNSEKWQKRIEAWTERVRSHQENLVSYLIVLRIAPLPPHWVVNVVAPHLGISVWHFWISTFLGIAGVSYIHTQIGTTLDQMTSSSDFHLVSWQNGLGLGGIVCAVLIPVVLRQVYRSDLEDAAQDSVDSDPSSSSSATEPLLPSTSADVGLRSSRSSRASPPEKRRHKGERPFSLLPPSSSSESSDGEGSDDESGNERQRREPAVGRGGNVDKASRVLGVQVRDGSADKGKGRPVM